MPRNIAGPASPPRIEVCAKPAGNAWIVSVRDNGIGFEPQYGERIFGLFKRLHKEEYPGTGLGLAILQTYRGTLQRAYLGGRKTRRGRDVLFVAAAHRRIMKALHILLAEDNPGDILLVQRALEEHQIEHELHIVRDGGEALAFMASAWGSRAAPRVRTLCCSI